MGRTLRAIVLLTLLAAPALGDALVLKDGRKLSGRVAEKPDGYEIVVEGQTLAFPKDEVAQWIKSPKEIVGDADKLVADAKKIYQEAVEIKDDKVADARFREALPKVIKARDAYAEARDLFPEGNSDLDTQLVQIMKLMRLIRERIGSELASGPAVKPKDEPPPVIVPEPKAAPKPEPKVEPASPKVTTFADALAVLVDPARRAKEDERAAARAIFRKTWEGKSPNADVAAAGAAVLARKELPKEALQALETFFAALGAEKLESVPEKEAAQAVRALAGRAKEARGRAGDTGAEVLAILAAAVASAVLDKTASKPSPELEAAFKDLGFEKSEYSAVWGRKEALALDDYRKWVASGDFGLAIVQFQNEYKNLTDVGSRYALGLLLTFKALADNRMYGRAASYLQTQSGSLASPAREHFMALSKSIREEAPCGLCGGSHKVNCTACKGKKKVNLECLKCGGSGKLNSFRGVVGCSGCGGKGRFVNVDCPKCKASGTAECKVRGCKENGRPSFESFAEAFTCPGCRGRGSLLRHVAWPCAECAGIGMILAPRADPTKVMIK